MLAQSRMLRAALLTGAVMVSACNDNTTAPPRRAVPPEFHQFIAFAPDAPEAEYLAICKVGPPDTYTFHAEITGGVGPGQGRLYYTKDGTATGTPILTGDTDKDGKADYQITVGASDFLTYGGNTVQGECLETAGDVHTDLAMTGGPAVTVSVGEVNIPADKQFVKTDVYVRDGNASTGTTSSTLGLGNPVSLVISGSKGANAVFFNQLNLTPPSLTVSKAPATQTVDAGDPIVFSMIVSNTGQATATGVTLSDQLPGGTLTWSTTTAGCTIDSANLLSCALGDLAGGATAAVTVTSAATTAAMCGVYDNTATAAAGNAATATSNTVSATVQCGSLSLNKTADNATVGAGNNIGFGMAVSSNGPATAKGVTLSDALPTGSGISWSIDSQPAGNPCSITSNTLNCAFGDMPAGASATVHVISPTTAASCASYPNTASVSSSNQPTVTSSATTAVTCQDLTVRKTASGSYDKTYSWTLQKSVTPTSHSGNAGSNAGTSTWTVVANQTVTNSNYAVAGSIVIGNPNAVAVGVSVADQLNDGTNGTVTCPSSTVAANGTLTCTYTAAPTGGTATLNTATVTVTTPGSIGGGTATAPVSFTANTIGDASVTLADPHLSYSQLIGSSTTLNIPETFPCPSTTSLYDSNGNYSYQVPNTATLSGANTNLSANATVTVNCHRDMFAGETATGAGFPWSATQGAPDNWFMYSPWVTTSGYRGISVTTAPAGTDLIAGQIYKAGRITGTRGSAANSTSITIKLATGYKFSGISENVKINPMSCTAAQPYVQPGAFTIKRTAAVSANSITITGLPNKACYGVHVNVDRPLP